MRSLVVFHPVPTVAHQLRSAIASESHDVFVAADAETFIQQAARADVAILGLAESDLVALEVLTAHCAQSSVPVIVCGPVDDPLRVIRVFRFGACDYCALPLAEDELGQRVGAALNKGARISRMGEYRIGRRLGSGGMGIVFDAYHVRTEAPAAVKMLLEDARDDFVEQARFEREIDALKSVHHPHLIAYLNDGEYRDARYLVMARAEGRPLYRADRTPPQVARVGAQIASALSALHEQAWIHRDIKPDNIFVDDDNNGVLIDLGTVLKKSDRRLTPRSARVGTPRYSAPEQLMGRPDERSDQYSLGCTLFEAITQRVPFGHDEDLSLEALLDQKRNAELRVRAFHIGCSSILDDIIAQMMAPKPKDRFANMDEVSEALAEVAALQHAAVAS